jgi:4-hydroxy-2-oxoglutarate aldolase
MSLSLQGVFAALTTPLTGDTIAAEKWRDNIRRYNRTGLSGYVVLGSTGEAVFLSDKESETLVAEAKAAAAARKKIIVGTSREATHLTIQFTNKMAGLGADAALIKPPHYYKSLMSPDVVRSYYLEVAEKSKIPVLVYHIPQNTGIPMDSATIIALSRHPNIAGIKDSSGLLGNLVDVGPAVRSDFRFLLGAGSIFLAGLLLGASGGILALAAAVPELCVSVYSLFREGKLEEARKLQLDLGPLNKALTQTMGIPALKYALDLLGYYGGPPRPPLLPLPENEKATIKEMLAKLGLPAS